MGWRWVDEPTEYVRTQIGRRPPEEEWQPLCIADGTQIWKRLRPESERHGYCGAMPGEMRIYADGDIRARSIVGVPINADQLSAHHRPHNHT